MAKQHGGAICSVDDCYVTFHNGRIVYSSDGSISFKINSNIVFKRNIAGWRGAIYSSGCSLSFEDNSTTAFLNNAAV